MMLSSVPWPTTQSQYSVAEELVRVALNEVWSKMKAEILQGVGEVHEDFKHSFALVPVVATKVRT